MCSSLASFYLAASLHPRKTWLWKSQIWSGFPVLRFFRNFTDVSGTAPTMNNHHCESAEVKPRKVPPLWAVPKLQTFVNYTSITNEGSGFLTPAGVQWRGWLRWAGLSCTGNRNFDTGMEELLLKIWPCFVPLVHRQRGPSCVIVSQSTCPDMNRHFQIGMGELTSQNCCFVVPDLSVGFAVVFSLLAIIMTAAEVPFWDQELLWNWIIYSFQLCKWTYL